MKICGLKWMALRTSFGVGGRGLVRGNASFRLATKLKELKQRIKVWNRDVFGRMEVNRNSAL